MTPVSCTRCLLLAPLTLLLACESPPSSAESALAPRVGGISAMSFANSEWSAPVNVGAPINTSAGEMNATLSPDGLSLYFTSNRADGFGGTDIWVSQRACPDCAWQSLANLGTVINGPGAEAGPRLSNDGHLLFFQSDRPGGNGSGDIYVTRRANPNDDFAWEPATHLGPDVNTAANENAAAYLQSAEDGAGNLYFNRPNPVQIDLFYAPVKRDGETRGPAVLVSELSDPTSTDQHASVRNDGREVFFSSPRAGGIGGNDLYVSTRDNVHEPWSLPVNLGVPLNTTGTDQQPSLSHDGRTLLFASDRPGGSGGQDLWISTRTPNGKEAP